MAKDSFVHLHLHTECSLLDGAIRMKELMKSAQEFKMPAVAVTDHGNLFGAIEFYQRGRNIQEMLERAASKAVIQFPSLKGQTHDFKASIVQPRNAELDNGVLAALTKKCQRQNRLQAARREGCHESWPVPRRVSKLKHLHRRIGLRPLARQRAWLLHYVNTERIAGRSDQHTGNPNEKAGSRLLTGLDAVCRVNG